MVIKRNLASGMRMGWEKHQEYLDGLVADLISSQNKYEIKGQSSKGNIMKESLRNLERCLQRKKRQLLFNRVKLHESIWL